MFLCIFLAADIKEQLPFSASLPEKKELILTLCTLCSIKSERFFLFPFDRNNFHSSFHSHGHLSHFFNLRAGLIIEMNAGITPGLVTLRCRYPLSPFISPNQESGVIALDIV